MVMYEIPWLELTRSGRGYMAVSQGDTVAAANAIIKLLDDVEYREKMGGEARKVWKNFWNLMCIMHGAKYFMMFMVYLIMIICNCVGEECYDSITYMF